MAGTPPMSEVDRLKQLQEENERRRRWAWAPQDQVPARRTCMLRVSQHLSTARSPRMTSSPPTAPLRPSLPCRRKFQDLEQAKKQAEEQKVRAPDCPSPGPFKAHGAPHTHTWAGSVGPTGLGSCCCCCGVGGCGMSGEGVQGRGPTPARPLQCRRPGMPWRDPNYSPRLAQPSTPTPCTPRPTTPWSGGGRGCVCRAGADASPSPPTMPQARDALERRRLDRQQEDDRMRKPWQQPPPPKKPSGWRGQRLWVGVVWWGGRSKESGLRPGQE
jgi:hypothetical protein